MTKEIPLTQGKVALVDDEDFEWLSQWKWYFAKAQHLGESGGYATRSEIHGERAMHRVILNAAKGVTVDHLDHDGLNNQRSNIRLATYSQNLANRKKFKNNTSGYKGVSLDKQSGKWLLRLVLKGFDTPEEAAHLRDKLAEIAFGEFNSPNFAS